MDELRQQFRKLVLKFHPDQGGTDQDIIKIKKEYNQLLKQFSTRKATTENQNYESNYENADPNDEMFKEIIIELIHLPLDIDIIGFWVWIDQKNSYPYKDKLKELKFQWSKTKRKWYWFPGIENRKGKPRTNTDYEAIKNKYGSRKVKTQEPKQLG